MFNSNESIKVSNLIYKIYKQKKSLTKTLINCRDPPFSPFLTGKMKAETKGLANSYSNIVAPAKQERENEWTIVQRKKSNRLAKKNPSSQVKKY